MIEEAQTNRFESIKNVIQIEKNNKLEFQKVIKREEESKQVIKDLQGSLISIKQEKEVEIQKRKGIHGNIC